jgi:hypothetical protein
MKQQLLAVRFKQVSIKVLVGVTIVLVATTAYDALRRRDGLCVQFYPDGSEKVLYGVECQ